MFKSQNILINDLEMQVKMFSVNKVNYLVEI